ncbi:MAG: DUF2914 domain-containing protein [Elusimicrobia bacterium]|nr:DUF2914 domain-containing protein [Elusimicrobiota bacterium]
MKKWFASVLMFAAVSGWAQAPAAPAAPAATPAETKAAPAPAAVKVEKILVATGVENREATGEATTFGAEVGQVYCWTKLAVTEPPAKVKYVWSMSGKPVYEHPIEIKTSGRWWASKKVQPGSWKVELQSESGESLGSVEFTVSAEAAAPAAAPAPAPATK